MLTIGEFAKHGGVSVRMLRHYDSIDLLRPAHTDPFTGYRRYEAAQLARLNRVIALKDLGFTLEQVGAILNERLSATEMRGMLRLRRAELAQVAVEVETRLARVEARLRVIESEGTMSTDDIVIKPLPPVRVAELTGTAATFEPQDIGPVISPLFEELCRLLSAAGVDPVGPGLARYEDVPDGGILVYAAMPVAAGVHEVEGAEVVEVPAVERAATIVHRGAMSEVLPTAQTLARWIEDNGHRADGYTREVTLAAPDDLPGWVTEIQAPLA
ncbi:DNA-binding transcriptional MerR regulator [Nocardiopsis sp. Huas11]|uniref:MerR family transcriptional regulator n=1 Tax=Nocardiopsis sp. Huas11 TaxID=2183912 RepID=UPI000EB0FF54|nr:MerR family transcriptional regulator [Nocardiopsis sp. Huas11]RKS05948.1 DNA-binding transcriptional MerR regulator [Nocardiopsis sp. Huas11]